MAFRRAKLIPHLPDVESFFGFRNPHSEFRTQMLFDILFGEKSPGILACPEGRRSRSVIQGLPRFTWFKVSVGFRVPHSALRVQKGRPQLRQVAVKGLPRFTWF